MNESLKKSIRNSIYAWIIGAAISLGFGIYDFIKGFEELNNLNIVYTILGATIASIPFFTITFVASLIFFFIKEKAKSKK